MVNEYNQVRAHENIYVIGDLAMMASEAFPKGHPMLAPTAISQASLLSKNIKRTLAKKPMQPYKYVNKGSMATIGRNLAVAEIKSAHFKGRLAWLIWIFVHLMSLVSFRNGGLANYQLQYSRSRTELPITRDYMAQAEAALRR